MFIMLRISMDKFARLDYVKSLMELSQHLVQAVYFGESSLYQLPHLGPDLVQEMKRSRKTPVHTSQALKELPADQRRETLKYGLSEQQWIDIDRVCDQIPDPRMSK
jgi:preprotein translocase subunit Sec63